MSGEGSGFTTCMQSQDARRASRRARVAPQPAARLAQLLPEPHAR
jgi:hypothetical protein